MMKRIFFVSTALFWVAVLALGLAALWRPAARPPMPSAPPVSPTNQEGAFTLREVEAHNQPEDCWMAIGGLVYDLTAYLPEHPSAPDEITMWCGRESTEGYNTKNRDRPHSPYASELLERYRIGRLGPRAP